MAAHLNRRDRDRLDGRGRLANLPDLISGTFILLAILLVIQFAWQYWGSGLDAVNAQETIVTNAGIEEPDTTEIAEPQDGDPPVLDEPTEEGTVIGWMWIPRLGDDWKRAIQEGTDDIVLDNLGLGHYTGTAMPGDIGNSSYAGHRTPSDLGYADTLESGDAIVIQTADYWYVYHVQSSWITSMYDTDVIDPVNDESRLLTLTTCEPMYSPTPATERLIVRADFVYWAYTADGIPEELADEQETPADTISETIRDVSQYAPITPMLAIATLAIWAVFALVCFLLFRKDRPHRAATWNPLALMWRLQTGPTAIRVIGYVIMWIGIVFACWAWICPWLADTIPWLDSPYAAVT